MEAVILAGGQGTRLKPYTTDLAKALVPVCGRPVIEILLHRMKLAGVTKVHLAVNHLADQIREALGNGDRFGIPILYSEEPSPLSTVGPLRLINGLPEHFIVANADVLTDLDLEALFKNHVRSACKVTVAVYRRTEKIDYGVLNTDVGGRVIGFAEKPDHQFLVSMGVYVFARSVLDYVPNATRFGFDDLMLTLLARSEPVNTLSHVGFWLDIGRRDDYERANSQDREAVMNLLR
jgi:NDP-mannose synthase